MQNGIEYEIISWNRDGTDKPSETSFNLNINKLKRFQKFIPFIKYLTYIKSTIRKNKYDKLIVFGPQIALLLYPFLKKGYNNNFILDYRDLSIDQLPILKIIFKKVVEISNLNIISSIGFKKYLPEAHYIISHNISSDLLINQGLKKEEDSLKCEDITVLTIGSIRDYEANLEVVKALANKENIKLFFVGKGEASALLEKYTLENNIKNIFFHGFYKKGQEVDYIRKATFLNIYYPQIKSHSSALSNRFYNSLIYSRPMIVTSNSIQGDFVEQYNLGISINNCNHLEDKLRKFNLEFNEMKFNNSAEKLLTNFKTDYDIFQAKVLSFFKFN